MLRNKSVPVQRAVLIVGTAAIVGLLKLTVGKLVRWVDKRMTERKWREIAKKVRDERDAKLQFFVAKYSSMISEKRILEIVSMDLSSLAESIKRRSVTSFDAVLAYSLRAATVGKDLGLLTHDNFEEALKDAQAADELISTCENPSDLPPLIGVPVSVKDHMSVRNMPATLGFVALHDFKRDRDSLIVQVIRSKGAIPFVCTNVPQGVCSMDSSNLLWGKSRNPWNTKKAAGGSSGGEAGIVASRCSPFGLGSDMAGSIRIPSAFCGAYGFKPTGSRVSKMGVVNLSLTDLNSVPAFNLSLGPICRSAEDVILVSRNLLGNFQEDLNIDSKPFNNFILTDDTKPGRIGYIMSLDFVETAPDVKAKLNSVISNLKSKGYELVPFCFPEFDLLVQTIFDIFWNCDMVNDLVNLSQGEKLEDYNQFMVDVISTPLWWLKFLGKVMHFTGEKVLSKDLSSQVRFNRHQFIEANQKLLSLKAKFMTYYTQNNFEALLCPSWSLPGINLGQAAQFIGLTKFMFIFNIMDMPCVNIPIGLCEDDSYVKKSDQFYDRLVEETMKTCKGMPVGVMIGTAAKQDEKCLRLMKEIDAFYRFDLNHSHKVMERLDTLNKADK